jgi:hypothetical protein
MAFAYMVRVLIENPRVSQTVSYSEGARP